jgi:hypothetical protein
MLTNQLWDLGTAPTGSDGDSAREAGEKYNTHGHPGQQFEDNGDGFNIWKASADRIIGDLAVYLGVTYMWNGDAAIPLGIGAVAPGEVKVEEIVICTKVEGTVQVDTVEELDDPGVATEVVAADFFTPSDYTVARLTEDFKFRVVGKCIPVDPDSDYGALVTFVDMSAPPVEAIKYSATFGTGHGNDQTSENISSEIIFNPARRLYELKVTCANCTFIVYKAAIRVEYST